MKHYSITVVGKVQGVYFRVSTKAVADQLGIKGYVVNQPDGSVYVEAEGDKWNLDLFLEWCEEGPEEAEILAVTTTEGEMKGYKNFVVKK